MLKFIWEIWEREGGLGIAKERCFVITVYS